MGFNLRQRILTIKFIIHLICLFLLVNQYWLAFNDNLGADPVEAILHFTGIGAFNLLIVSLCISPLMQIFKRSAFISFIAPINYRRVLGLYSFVYGLVHLLSFLAFEVQFDWGLFISEIIERPYMTFGMCALVILLALAITSPNVVKRKMGSSWQKLHHWVYLAITLAVIHFYMSVKSDTFEPLIYGAITLVLLWFRRKKLLRYFSQ